MDTAIVVCLIVCGLTVIAVIAGLGLDNNMIIGIAAIVGVISFILTFVFGIALSITDYNRLIAQCMTDGKKEYECKFMASRNGSTIVPMPIFIPTGR